MSSTVSAKSVRVILSVGVLMGGLLGCSTKGKVGQEAKPVETKAEVKANAAAAPSPETRVSPVTKAVKAVKKEAAVQKTGAEAATAAVGDGVACKSGSDERSIEIKSTDGGGCEVIYTKAGDANSVARAANDRGHCETVADKIGNNLKTAGFTCE